MMGSNTTTGVDTRTIAQSGPGCDNDRVTRRPGAMHVETSRSHQTLRDGSVRTYERHLQRGWFRDGGKVRKATLVTLSHPPAEAIAAVRAVLAGKTLVDADGAVEVERSLPHGHDAAGHQMGGKLGLPA